MDIIARMRGGLGNQLFILAYAYSVSESYDGDNNIILDIREYENYKVREFELTKIVKDSKVKLLANNKGLAIYDITRSVFHITQRFIKRETNSIQLLSRFGLFYGRRKGIVPSFARTKKIYIYGYFQDAKMVCKVKEKMQEIIEFPVTEGYERVSRSRTIAVSIRCGKDYVEQGWPICSVDYYKRGIAIIREKHTGQQLDILVFADDIEVAKKMNIDENATYVERLSSIQQLSLMQQCDDFVIANSSFSWWGAFLGVKTDGVVIMPSKWYDSGENTNNVYLCYKNTMIIDI